MGLLSAIAKFSLAKRLFNAIFGGRRDGGARREGSRRAR